MTCVAVVGMNASLKQAASRMPHDSRRTIFAFMVGQPEATESEEQFFDSCGYTVLIVAQRNVVSSFIDRFLGIGHGYTHAGKAYHAEVVVSIAHGYHLFAGHAQFVE